MGIPGVESGVEVWLRRLGKEGRVREVQVPVGIVSEDQTGERRRKKRLACWLWEEFAEKENRETRRA